MHRELRLHEDVGRGALPGLTVAKVTAVDAVVVKPRRTDACGAMVKSVVDALGSRGVEQR